MINKIILFFLIHAVVWAIGAFTAWDIFWVETDLSVWPKDGRFVLMFIETAILTIFWIKT